VLLVALGNALGRAAAAPPQDELLRATTHVSYDVRPDSGPVRAFWDVELENNDPETVFNEVGTSYYYGSYPVPILRGASSIVATGPNRSALPVGTEDPGDVPFVFATVEFDRGLFYGRTYSFSLSYQLTAARYENLLVAPS